MVKQIFKWTSNLLITFLLIVCVLTIYSIFQSKSNQGQIPTILGNTIMIVSTGSMEPMLSPGDLIFVKSIDPVKVKENDVISYQNSNNTVITHKSSRFRC